MGIYIFLLGLELICSLLLFSDSGKNRWLLRISIFVLFLISACKSTSIGIDTEGYASVYQKQAYLPWADFDYFYFEWGYMLLMKIASKVFNLTFNEFCVVIYAFIYYSYYHHVKKYSSDYGLSVLIFTCYTFFVFFLSGLRNSIAIAVCLWAFDCLMRRDKRGLIQYLILVIIASFIHTSAIIYLFAYPLSRYKPDIRVTLILVAVSAAALLFRDHIFSYINTALRDVGDAGTLSMGGSSFFLIGLSALSIIALVLEGDRLDRTGEKASVFEAETAMCVFVCLGTLLTMFSPGDSVLVRTAMYYTIFASVLIPNILRYCERHISWLLRTSLIIFLVIYFLSSLNKDILSIVPYEMWI